MGISSNGKEKTKEAILSNLNEKQAIESRSITTNINDHKLVTKEKTRERVSIVRGHRGKSSRDLLMTILRMKKSK